LPRRAKMSPRFFFLSPPPRSAKKPGIFLRLSGLIQNRPGQMRPFSWTKPPGGPDTQPGVVLLSRSWKYCPRKKPFGSSFPSRPYARLEWNGPKRLEEHLRAIFLLPNLKKGQDSIGLEKPRGGPNLPNVFRSPPPPIGSIKTPPAQKIADLLRQPANRFFFPVNGRKMFVFPPWGGPPETEWAVWAGPAARPPRRIPDFWALDGPLGPSLAKTTWVNVLRLK